MILWSLLILAIFQINNILVVGNQPLQNQNQPKSSTTGILFPTTLFTTTNLVYTTTIQHDSNDGEFPSADYSITTNQNWAVVSPTELLIQTELDSNASSSSMELSQQTLSYTMQNTNNTPETANNTTPAILTGPWEHAWPIQNQTTYPINVQELSYTFDKLWMTNISYQSDTILQFNDTAIPVRVYTGNVAIHISCG